MPGATGRANVNVAVCASASTAAVASCAAPLAAGATVTLVNLRSAAFKVIVFVALLTLIVTTARALNDAAAASGVSETW